MDPPLPPFPAQNAFETGGKWKNTAGPTCCPGSRFGFTINPDPGTVTSHVRECFGKQFVCLFSPVQCLCHTAVPCRTNKETGSTCYYAWACLTGFIGCAVTVYDDGNKFREELFCINCGEYECA